MQPDLIKFELQGLREKLGASKEVALHSRAPVRNFELKDIKKPS